MITKAQKDFDHLRVLMAPQLEQATADERSSILFLILLAESLFVNVDKIADSMKEIATALKTIAKNS